MFSSFQDIKKELCVTIKNVDFIKLNPLKNPFKITLNNPLKKITTY